MPSNGIYNWACVLHAAIQIVETAARIKAAQIGTLEAARRAARPKVPVEREPQRTVLEDFSKPSTSATSDSPSIVVDKPTRPKIHHAGATAAPEEPIAATEPIHPVRREVETSSLNFEQPSTIPNDAGATQTNLHSSPVPTTRIGRLFHYTGLATSLALGTASAYVRGGNGGTSSRVLSEANLRKLVDKLSRMRGAALKLGQFMSIQDAHVLPPELDRVFRRVQDSAHYMPNWQMEKVMKTSLGPEYQNLFSSFDTVPFAAASIGQVHAARLAAEHSPTGNEEDVVVKIQFPGIRESINSDLSLLTSLLTASMFLPKGLFLDKTIAAMKEELAEECNYTREAGAMVSFSSFLSSEVDRRRFRVPWVAPSSTKEVLIMERLRGLSVGSEEVRTMDQRTRNEIGTRIVELCLRELFSWRTMQTDPNWSNFFWDTRTQQLQLLDFGATRRYSAEFMENWRSLLQSAIDLDREGCKEWSLQLGYLIGGESDAMLDAHVDSIALLASPFRLQVDQPYQFGPGSPWSKIVGQIRGTIPTILRERLTPPPRETYSLNRKLSGAFLLASRLNASIDCKALWDSLGR